MCTDDETFARYALGHHAAPAFVPNFDDAEQQIFAASLASTRGRLAAISPLSISIGYIDTMVPNAFAGRDADRHYIGMHQALLVTIVDLALFGFTQKAFFPAIGNAAGEDSPEPAFGSVPGLFLLDRTLQGAGIDADTDHHRVPKDADRHVAAIYFALLMARFVWLHEWAHCQFGHVERLQAKSDAASLVEVEVKAPLVGFPAVPDLSPPPAARHIMELDADRAALDACLAISAAGLENIPGIAAFDDITRTALIVTGAYLMTWLFEAYARHLQAATQATHPSPADRRAALATIAPTLLSSRGSDDAPLLCERAEEAFELVVRRIEAATPPTG